MRASLPTALLLVLMLLSDAGRAQAREGALAASAQSEAWNAYPESVTAPSSTLEQTEAPFEPNRYPGESAASALPEGHPGDAAAAEAPAPRDEFLVPVEFPESPALVPVAAEALPSESLGHSEAAVPDSSTPSWGEALPSHPPGHSEAAVPDSSPHSVEDSAVDSTPAHFPAEESAVLPGHSAMEESSDASSRPGLLPPSSAPRYSAHLAPEPLAVPLLRSVLDVAGASAVTLGSAVMVEALVGTRCLRETDRMCILTSFLVTFLSVAGTAPVGAWAVGSLLGGEGKLWAAYMGAAIGMGLGVIGTMPTMAFGNGVILGVAGPIGAVVGAAIGYEVSHRRARRASPGPRMTPMLGATPRGDLVGGMMGSF
ncbi:hypothetical protein [Pyxidicoccus xibeiensis]|uniref:hypothetical protein n=1 Tax=Pyxidicoccus xibeiensis TaxID=2906759 RepID=UPI0020A70AEE|nr:hypothetical protein [Pyxidicoccus xibeiensis]MCP3145327.1 hypothetical protein [Pyxidicoccus xibeiensis]